MKVLMILSLVVFTSFSIVAKASTDQITYGTSSDGEEAACQDAKDKVDQIVKENNYILISKNDECENCKENIEGDMMCFVEYSIDYNDDSN